MANRSLALTPALAATLLCGAAAQDWHPEFDPSALKGPQRGPQNEIAVLGTAHLSGLPDGFEPAALAGLLDRLAAWAPQEIFVEELPGRQCEEMRRNPARYAETVKSYCPDTTAAREATGLDVPQATAEADRLLAAWPEAPSPAERRRLAAVFLAAGEPGSALVQWLHLPKAERRVGDGLDAVLVARLDKLAARRNETSLISAPLAVRLGLQRLHPMDDHTADLSISAEDDEAASKAIVEAWDNPASARRAVEADELNEDLASERGVLALYRAYNAPGQARLVFESDFGATLEEPSPRRFGRQYLGYWETRNLRMAANIREVLGLRPGTRGLVVVGASHKGYLEAYLDQMHDLRLVDSLAVIGDDPVRTVP